MKNHLWNLIRKISSSSMETISHQNPCLYEKPPLSIGLSSIATNEIFNPIISPAHKNFERVIVDAYVYHADLVVRILRVGDWRGNHFTNLKHNSKVSQGQAFFPKTSTFRRWHGWSTFCLIARVNKHRDIIVRIFFRVFLSLTISDLEQKEDEGMKAPGMFNNMLSCYLCLL